MAALPLQSEERQITRGAKYDHALDNNDNFSPDDRYLVFDTRKPERIIDSKLIAKVEIATGEVTEVYRPEHAGQLGPGVGAASYAPDRDEVAFIHGPLHATGPDDQYEKHRRLGAIVRNGRLSFADARDVTPPFTVGALRGGTHRHEYSGDGKWIGFTYNDEVVRAHGLNIGRELDLRTIGVTLLGRPVNVPPSPMFPGRSEGFSVLVVVVVPDPKPGSDEISNAAFDSWVGTHGYRRPDGIMQGARAFIGTARSSKGEPLDDLYIVDIPQEITVPGPLGPLEGTVTTFPMPPSGTVQRRLLNSENRPHPGCQGIARSSPDGSRISFRMRDENGCWQIFLIPPAGGEPRQATFVAGGVDTDARWHPSGNVIASVAGRRILLTDVREGERFGTSETLVECASRPTALVWSHSGRLLAYNRYEKTGDNDVMQIFVADYP